MTAVKVLIVDDSALVRKVLTSIFSSDPGIVVVGTANDPAAAWEKIQSLDPDVLTLDVEMPRMDGISFLRKLMRARPMPVVMVSSLTEAGGEATIRALELGAVDFIAKPKLEIERGIHDLAGDLVARVKQAARARVRRPAARTADLAPAVDVAPDFRGAWMHKVIAIGASTGGPEALVSLMRSLPADCPGIVIVQHMPEKYTAPFAKRLDGVGRVRVKEAEDGDRLLPGHALLAPGGRQMEFSRSGAEYRVRVFAGEPVNRHRPSVDVLFHSCAARLGGNAVGVILTGMGADGAKGLAAMRAQGARTIAQSEATCVVFGMPKEAILAGGAEETLGLEDIPAGILRLAAAKPGLARPAA